MTWFEIVALVLTVGIVVAVVTAVVVTIRLRRKVSFMIDALEDRETGFRYADKCFSLFRFNRTMNRLRQIFDREMDTISEQNRYYGKMLDNIKTGIIVFIVSDQRFGQITYSNVAAMQVLGIMALSHIRQLSIISDELQQAFEQVSDNKELRCSFYNERNKITISLTATEAEVAGQEVKIVTFNNITGDLEHSEELSWNKLVRVLNHEIMNTITPIASLSEAFSEDLKQAREDGGARLNLEELEQGFETIASSSKGLIRFVDNYRNLTRVSPPVKQAFFVRDLIDKVRKLTEEQVAASGAVLQYVEKSDDVLLYADENQISQIIINLIKNALQAEARIVEIEAKINFAEQVVVSVSNNGRPISPQSAEEIFVPFYTTKQDGSGIGLSLSRQIMRLHNGAIVLERSDEKITTFSLYFK